MVTNRAGRGRGRTAAAVLLVTAAVAAALAAGGCAYFNTLYNAKAKFSEAQDQPLDRDGRVSRSAEALYDQVLAKCHKMIETWPDSRHVDDARLLIARSYYGAERYENAVLAADTLIDLHPDTDLMDKALALKGLALARSDQHEEAVHVLIERVERYGPTPEVLYTLCTSLMSVDRSDAAVKYLQMMEEKYPNESETFDAQVAIAEILAEKDQLEKSREVYVRLTGERIPEDFRYRVWMGFADVDVRLERYRDALTALDAVDELVLTPEEEPPMLLERARAYAGADSMESAIRTYNDVASRFSRGEFAAEAHYRLGEIYEAQDSLQTAEREYRAVSQAYANSDYSPEAVRRANNLSQLLKLQAAAGDDSPEANAMRTFSMAELQLLQFKHAEKALAAYEEILDKYPESDYAPKAAYAVGYIYGVVEGDSARAVDAYRDLLTYYPDSQQAEYANRFVDPFGGPPPGLEIVPNPIRLRSAASPDTTGAAGPDSTAMMPDTTRAAPRTVTPPDTSRAVTPPDTMRATTPPGPSRKVTAVDTARTAPRDTTRATSPADTTRRPVGTPRKDG